MLARVELKSDIKGAVALQKMFKMTQVGTPKISPAVNIPTFSNTTLPGVELFDNAEKLLSGALDISPVAAQMQAKVRYRFLRCPASCFYTYRIESPHS